MARLIRAVGAALAVGVAAMIVGLVIDGLGIGGIITTLMLMVAAFVLLLIFPRPKAPTIRDVQQADIRQLADQTSRFLDAQRPALPPTTQAALDRLESNLDQLSPQLSHINERDGIAQDARKLLGEHLPTLIGSFTRLPTAMRDRNHAGSTPEVQLTSGLDLIAREVANLTSQIAQGDLDTLATRGRYLESKYEVTGDGP